ncbi:MAG: DNA gyrase C-terminal beta-propeller domain-containing protein [Anaerolineae bacterium]
MQLERPDLSQLDPVVRAYIESLEAELERRREEEEADAGDERAPAQPLEPSEPPTTLNLITVSLSGMAKRTPRHHYWRQRRGGMGVFDLETSENDPPAFLTIADESQSLLLITTHARAFSARVSDLPESPVRSRGQLLTAKLPLRPDERLAIVLPSQNSGYVNLVTERGHVRRLRYNYIGANLRPGSLLFEPTELGAPAAACWTSGEADIFIATRQGKAIRFAEQRVPFSGCLGIRLDRGDTVVAVTPASDESSVFLLSADGKGSIRQMAGFASNKAPGAGGKVALKTDRLAGAVAVTEADDIFAISRLGKLVRFQAAEVPPKEGVVQGVNCMSLRADETAALAVGRVGA